MGFFLYSLCLFTFSFSFSLQFPPRRWCWFSSQVPPHSPFLQPLRSVEHQSLSYLSLSLLILHKCRRTIHSTEAFYSTFIKLWYPPCHSDLQCCVSDLNCRHHFFNVPLSRGIGPASFCVVFWRPRGQPASPQYLAVWQPPAKLHLPLGIYLLP